MNKAKNLSLLHYPILSLLNHSLSLSRHKQNLLNLNPILLKPS